MTITDKRSDQELLQLLHQGQEEALDVLLTRYKEPVRKKAGTMFLIGGEREDLIQEGMIGLLNAIRTYRPENGASFAHYADTCVTRKMYQAIESSNRLKQLPLNTAVSLFQTIEQEGNVELMEILQDREGRNPEELLIDRENVSRMERRMETELSPFERSVLELMLTGMDYLQIAEVLGKTGKQVDNAIQRIRKKLK